MIRSYFFGIQMYYLEIALYCETERALDRLPNIQFLCILDTYFIRQGHKT